ncbi:MAG: hypothetical protein MUD10_01700 [Candidatus Pacebacteria bacterium]|jgi:hypothetical protein|nr:hypothetical protein [Candidatus Paceibacterota bacterium]
MANNVSYHGYFKFALTDRQFSLIQRLEFLMFWVLLALFTAFTLHSLWYLDFFVIGIFGLPVMGLVFAWYYRLYKIFTVPFAKSRGVDEQQLKSQDQIAKDYVAGQRNRPSLLALAMVAVISAIFFGLPFLDIPPVFFYSFILLLIVCCGFIAAKIRGMWTAVGGQADVAVVMKKSSRLWTVFIMILIVLVALVVVYRYKELNGGNFFGIQ